MKKIALLLFGCLIAGTTALCQNPLAEVEIIRLWNARKDIPATPNTSYKWKIPGDTAYYFQPIEGKTIEATITFKEVTGTPPPLVLKIILDNTSGVYKDAAGNTINAATNVYNTSTWNNFSQAVAPNPSWCAVFHNTTASFAYVTNYKATFTFTGKRAELWGEKTDNKGIVGIRVDGGTETTVDLYANTAVNNSQNLYTIDTPQGGTHTFEVRITGQKNPAALQTNLLIDCVKVYE